MKLSNVVDFVVGAAEGVREVAVICGGFALLAIAAKYCAQED